jgi:hypothetical protein
MWRTSSGIRVLNGAEAKLFAEVFLNLLDKSCVFQFEDYEFGIETFDNLTFGQKMCVLMTIANGLLREDVEPVRLTAAFEAAIAVVFEHLRNSVEFEIDEPEAGTCWRCLIVAVQQEMDGEETPEVSCCDYEEWDIEIQTIEDCVLRDADYLDGHLYLDRPPEESKLLREASRIPDEYYAAIPNDLTDEQINKQLRPLRKLSMSIIEAS